MHILLHPRQWSPHPHWHPIAKQKCTLWEYPILLSLLVSGPAFEFCLVLSNRGRPKVETSTKWGKFFPRAVAGLTSRELHHDVGWCVGCICSQSSWGAILSVQTRPQLRDYLHWVVRLAARNPVLSNKAQTVYSSSYVNEVTVHMLLYIPSSCLPCRSANGLTGRQITISQRATWRMSACSVTAAGLCGDKEKFIPTKYATECAALYPFTSHCSFAEYSVTTPAVILLWFLVK